MNKALLTPHVANEWLKTDVPSLATIQETYRGLEHQSIPASGDLLARPRFAKAISFAIPCAEALRAISARSSSLVEIGAGTGYWSALLAKKGIDVLASDISSEKNHFRQKVGTFYPVSECDAISAIASYPGRDILMCWPSYDEDWSANAIATIAPGRLLYWISEGPGGCVSCDDAFNQLETSFEQLAEIPLPQWWGTHDRLDIYRRRRLCP